MANRSRAGNNRTQIYNIVTAVMLGLTIVCCLAAAYMAITAPRGQQDIAEESTPFVIPTFTPRAGGPTMNPIWTVGPPPTSTTTPTPSITPSITPTPTETTTLGPTRTGRPTDTPTPTNTFTPTLTYTPSNTPVASATSTTSPFPYILRDNTIVYTNNTFGSTPGCNWAGIAGLIFDTQDRHKLGVIVHLTGGGLDETTTSGSNTAYGASGWEFVLDNKPIVGTFFIQLESGTGQSLSARITVNTVESCNSNLALLFFDEVP